MVEHAALERADRALGGVGLEALDEADTPAIALVLEPAVEVALEPVEPLLESRIALRQDRLVELLNERLAGLTLDEIRKTCASRVVDLKDDDTGLVQLILNESSHLFRDASADRTIEMEGTTHILSQPEFTDADSIRDLMELIDDESSVVRLLENPKEEKHERSGRATVHIGREMTATEKRKARNRSLSVVTAPYYRSNMQGTIGIVGPTRMDYARVIALVEGVAMFMSWPDQKAHRA